MPDITTPDPEVADAAERLPYAPPELRRHGDIESLTQAEYGGLDAATHGLLFAMTSPEFAPLPDAPIR